MINANEIGLRIKQLRGQMSQQEFADMLGVGRVTVTRYENGSRTPDAEFIAKINTILEVDPMWLLMGRGVAPVLNAKESALLDNYRNSNEAGKKAVETTASAFANADTVKKAANGG